MPHSTTASPRLLPRVVIVGGGFAGQTVARELRNTTADIVLIDKNNYQTFQPLLYQVATADLDPDEIAYPIRRAFQKQSNFRFCMSEVANVDWQHKRVMLKDDQSLDYDFLVLAAGSTPNYFGISGAEENSYPLKSLDDAIQLRSHVLKTFEAADQNPALIDQGLLNFVIIGGGPTGVEMAGAMIELFQHVLKRDYPHLPVEKARVILIEAGDSLLGAFTEESRQHAYETLKERGVHVACGEKVIKITQDAIYLESKRLIRTSTPIWAVGVKACPLAEVLGLEQTRGGRIVVNEDLSVPGKPNVFISGDMAGSCDETGRLHPQLASVARQGASHVAKQIRQCIEAQEDTEVLSGPFRYRNRGIMATISRHSAVAEFPGDIRLEGVFAWLTWLMLHLLLLIGFRNRLHVLISWVCNYCTKDRSSRLILNPTVSSPITNKPAAAVHERAVLHTPKPVKSQVQQKEPVRYVNESLLRIKELLKHADELPYPIHNGSDKRGVQAT